MGVLVRLAAVSAACLVVLPAGAPPSAATLAAEDRQPRTTLQVPPEVDVPVQPLSGRTLASSRPPQIVYSVGGRGRGSAVVRLDPLSGARRTLVATRTDPLSAGAWSAALGRVYYSRLDSRFREAVDSLPQGGGRSRREVTNGSSVDVSRDGRRMVYALNEESGLTNVFVADRSGRNARRLTGAGGYEPRFSADGRRVVFTRFTTFPDEDVQGDLLTIRTDGTGLARVTGREDQSDGSASFSPDGTRLLFERFSLRDYTIGVWSVGVDGRGLRLVRADAHFPDWSPNGWLTYVVRTRGDVVADGPDPRPVDPGRDHVAVRAPGLPGEETVLTRETSSVYSLRFAR